MDPEVDRLITAIHQAKCSCVLSLTGGGATAASQLLAVPGASRTILEIQVPYSEESVRQFLGIQPKESCSAQTGVALAEAAWSRAFLLRGAGHCVGLGCTASLATDRPKRGDHRFFAAAAVEEIVIIQSVTFEKGARSRAEEEEIVARAILNLLAEVAGVNERLDLMLRPGEMLNQKTVDRGVLLGRFIRREFGRLYADSDGRLRDDATPPSALLAGSFNPLHEAHCHLAHLVADRLHLPVAFELSVSNVDKPPLDLAAIRSRVAQFHGRSAVWLTHAPTFVEKARLFPGCVFVLGVDTAARLLAAQYYEGGEPGMQRAAAELRARGCRFLVAARSNREGLLVGLEDVTIPNCFQGLLDPIPKSVFNMPVSSSALRQRARPTSCSEAD